MQWALCCLTPENESKQTQVREVYPVEWLNPLAKEKPFDKPWSL